MRGADPSSASRMASARPVDAIRRACHGYRMLRDVFRSWMHGSALLPQFAVLSLAVVALSALGLSLVISHALKADLLEREWTSTADYIRTEIHQNLDPADFAAPYSEQARARFQRFYQHAVMMPEIVRIKVYDTDMRVIWSDEGRLVGRRFE